MLLVESEEDARIEENYIRIYFLLKVRYDFVLLLSLFLSSFFLIVLSNHRQFSLYIATIIYYKSDVYTTTENHVRPYLPILHGQVADSNGMYSSRLAHVKSNK